MADRDLTPAEARAEVEAFMGEGWRFQVYEYETHDGARPVPCVYCEQANMDGLDFRFTAPTYRAAVDALKAAWRDAVRPWCLNTMELATDCVVSWESSSGDCWEYQDEFSRKIGAEGIVARVLKEDQ